MPDSSRDFIDQLISAADFSRARFALEQFWRDSPGSASAAFVVSRFALLRPHLELRVCRVAILRSFTLEPAIPLLRALAFVAGIDLEVRVGGFNTWQQDILNPSGWLYAWSPDVAILAVHARDVLSRDSSTTDVADTFDRLIRALRPRSTAHLIIHSLEFPAMLVDQSDSVEHSAAVKSINDALAGIARQMRNVYLLDYNALIARHGFATWHDERKWVLARMPIAAGHLIDLAREWMRFLHPITGRVCKAIAVDLDNTLWAGVLGEDGAAGIRTDGPGSAFLDVQRALLDLHDRGILLAICSKNDEVDSLDVLSNHPAMLLRPSHFSALRINWIDKAENLRDIASELNIGLDAIAFLDDNPVERDWVRQQIPEVAVIDLPADAALFASAIREFPYFARLAQTAEDASRGRLYAEQRMRTQSKESAPSVEEFLRSLQMRAQIAPIIPATLARAAQLTQKTNQFNLTSRRYSEQQLSAMLASPTWQSFTISIADRFGDNGIVGFALAEAHGKTWEINTFLLSCRVIGRTVEAALLAAVANAAVQAGATILSGCFIPTRKNAPAANFYPLHRFTHKGVRDGSTFWELDLTVQCPPSPPWVEHVKEPTA